MSETRQATPAKAVLPQPGAIRYDHTGPIRVLAAADGYLMVRRPRRTPFVIDLEGWLALAAKPVVDGELKPSF